jgi:hypothetical protein
MIGMRLKSFSSDAPPAPQSGAELAALASARLALQEAALAAHFEATVGAPLATQAVRQLRGSTRVCVPLWHALHLGMF